MSTYSDMTSYTDLTIAIGRNVGGAPMSDERWREFQDNVIDKLAALGAPDRVLHGNSEWQSVSEDTCVMTWWRAELHDAINTETVRNMVQALMSTARSEFNQDAIAVTWGATAFA